MIAEEWRPVAGFPAYEVSDAGRVRSSRSRWGILATPHLLKPWTVKAGYRWVTLSPANGPQAKFSVHSLVLLCFVGPRPEGMTDIRHLNGDKSDNRLENLAYGTRAENERDKVRHGGNWLAAQTHCKHGHPFSGDNLAVDSRGRRRCRTCGSARSAITYAVSRGAPRVDLGTYLAERGEVA